MRETAGHRLPTRIQGQPAITRSLTALLVRVVRYGQHRARTIEEQHWAARVADRVAEALASARGVKP